MVVWMMKQMMEETTLDMLHMWKKKIKFQEEWCRNISIAVSGIESYVMNAFIMVHD